ncbi:MAG: hypothetical protein HC875_04930 [Anaerolineales bacterium]|nr:hypothetical protein [Anaerolineales bacterium]
MTKYQRVTGMLDVLFDDQPYWRFILAKIQETTDLFGYQRIDTPLLEQASLFVRGVGQGTDIVEKEMYIFDDRDGDQLALRPEFTAGIMRAYVENGLHTLPPPCESGPPAPSFATNGSRKAATASTASSISRSLASKTRRWMSR